MFLTLFSPWQVLRENPGNMVESTVLISFQIPCVQMEPTRSSLQPFLAPKNDNKVNRYQSSRSDLLETIPSY